MAKSMWFFSKLVQLYRINLCAVAIQIPFTGTKRLKVSAWQRPCAQSDIHVGSDLHPTKNFWDEPERWLHPRPHFEPRVPKSREKPSQKIDVFNSKLKSKSGIEISKSM